MTAPLDTQLITDAAGLRALKEIWDGLAARYPAASVFLTHSYACAWWRAFGRGIEMRMLVVRQNGEPIGILPLMKSTWHAFGVPLRQLSFFRNHHTLRADGLLPVEPLETVRAALKFLIESEPDWDVLYLHDVPEASPLRSVALEAAASAGLRCDAWSAGRVHRYLRLTGTWDEYLAGRSGNFRWQMKKCHKRLQAFGRFEVECTSGREALLAALPGVFALERRSWQGSDARSAMTDADRLFARALIEEAPHEELGEIWQLRIGGELAGALSLLRFGRRLYLFISYYDAEFAEGSPGSILFAEMLQSVWSRQLEEFDFNGDSHAFRRYASQAHPHFSARVYAPGVVGRLAQLSRGVIRLGCGGVQHGPA